MEIELIVSIACKNGGMITSKQAERAGIPRTRLSEMTSTGKLDRVARGVYCLPDAWEDEYAIAQLRFPHGILSDDTALFLHDFTDRTPEKVTMTFRRSYNATRVRESQIEVRTCSDEVFELGIMEVRSPSGNLVRAYNLERTLCDMMRGRRTFDKQVVIPAIKRYVHAEKRDIGKLLRYAQTLGVERKIHPILEVLL